MKQKSRKEDEGISPDERTMNLLQTIGNSIHESIRLEIDFPSKYDDRKIPMLDLKLWIGEVNGEPKILYEHYVKPMSAKGVLHAHSALPMNDKRTILTQEALRVMTNCSKNLPWEVVCGHMNRYMLRMQYSGYDKNFRCQVVESALNAYETIKSDDDIGLRPMYRPKNWNRLSRAKEKKVKKRNWYSKGGFKSVIFVPCTPASDLKKRYQWQIQRSGLKIRVVERAGRSLKSQLQKSNPFRKDDCGREACFICRSGGKGNCMKESVTYRIECKGDCERKNVYKGESSNSGYTRGQQHQYTLSNRYETSQLWKHCIEEHQGQPQQFMMHQEKAFRKDPLLRQITEAVNIRNTPEDMLMNGRNEWQTGRIPQATIIT